MQQASSQGTGNIEKKKAGPVREIFGQFATREFWKELSKTLVQEAITTFLMALGGTLVWYGKSRRNKDVANTSAGVGNTGEVSSKAFGGGFAPNPSFFSNSGPSYPAPTSPTGDNRYPGF